MIVECVSDDIRSVDPKSGLEQEVRRWFGTDTYRMNLTVGRLYVVYAVAVEQGWLRYFIADDMYARTQYPFSFFATFFKVIDRRLSRCWTLRSGNGAAECSDFIITFDEWADDPSFYERLVDGEDEARGTFRRRKELMDLEFPSPSVSDSAENVEDDWLLCPKCDDAWESKTKLGMVKCPKCRAVLLNPKYEGEASDFSSG